MSQTPIAPTFQAKVFLIGCGVISWIAFYILTLSGQVQLVWRILSVLDATKNVLSYSSVALAILSVLIIAACLVLLVTSVARALARTAGLRLRATSSPLWCSGVYGALTAAFLWSDMRSWTSHSPSALTAQALFLLASIAGATIGAHVATRGHV